MSKREKLVGRFKRRPSDFTWDEMTRLLGLLGYKEEAAGKTAGSRRRFSHPSGHVISLHKPHPGRILKRYAMDEVRQALEEEGLL